MWYHRMRNPYYRYNLARDALSAGDWDAAIGLLKYTIRKRPAEAIAEHEKRGRSPQGPPP